MAWSYFSERDGKRINVDMLKAIRVLEKLSGEQLVFVSQSRSTVCGCDAPVAEVAIQGFNFPSRGHKFLLRFKYKLFAAEFLEHPDRLKHVYVDPLSVSFRKVRPGHLFAWTFRY